MEKSEKIVPMLKEGMTAKDLIQLKIKMAKLAKDKGFISKFLFDKPYIHSNKEPLRWFFWLTELRLWLNEKGITIEISPDRDLRTPKVEKYIIFICFPDKEIFYWDFQKGAYENEIDALTVAVETALNTLPNVD